MVELSPIEWAVLPLKKYATFSGRAPRAEYWWFYLGTVIVQIPLTILDSGLGEWAPLSSLFSLVTLLPWLAVSVRRLHDINRSGWWLFALFATIILVAITWVAAFGSLGADFNAADSEPSGSMVIGMIVGVIAVTVIAIAVLMFSVKPGTDGPNDYGADPYGRDNLQEVFA